MKKNKNAVYVLILALLFTIFSCEIHEIRPSNLKSDNIYLDTVNVSFEITGMFPQFDDTIITIIIPNHGQ